MHGFDLILEYHVTRKLFVLSEIRIERRTRSKIQNFGTVDLPIWRDTWWNKHNWLTLKQNFNVELEQHRKSTQKTALSQQSGYKAILYMYMYSHFWVVINVNITLQTTCRETTYAIINKLFCLDIKPT